MPSDIAPGRTSIRRRIHRYGAAQYAVVQGCPPKYQWCCPCGCHAPAASQGPARRAARRPCPASAAPSGGPRPKGRAASRARSRPRARRRPPRSSRKNCASCLPQIAWPRRRPSASRPSVKLGRRGRLGGSSRPSRSMALWHLVKRWRSGSCGTARPWRTRRASPRASSLEGSLERELSRRRLWASASRGTTTFLHSTSSCAPTYYGAARLVI